MNKKSTFTLFLDKSIVAINNIAEKNISISKYVILGIIFISTFNICSITPLHSDDFGMMLKVSEQGYINSIYNFYLGWSGRIIAYAYMLGLLSTKSNFIHSFCTALCLTIFCYSISSIPRKVLNLKESNLLPLFIYMIYWIFNPDLGQTTFWISGSAQYLWTNTVVVSFLALFFHFRNSTNIFIQSCILFFAFCAGCSVENVCVSLVICFIGILFLLKKQDRNFSIKKNCIYLISLILGSLVLIGAPGNYVRLADSSFNEWHSLSIPEKVIVHLKRVYSTLKYLKKVIVIFIAFIVARLFCPKLEEDKKNRLVWMMLFLLTSICSIAVLTVVPLVVPRTMHGPFTFFLIAIAFLFDDNFLDKVAYVAIKYIFFLLLLYFFIRSYIFVYSSYYATFLQSKIREESILFYKERGESVCTIPQYFFPKLMSRREKFDLWHSPTGMGAFFGIDRVLINDNTKFDYSVLKEGKEVSAILKNEQMHKSQIVKTFVKESSFFKQQGVIMIDVTDVLFDKKKNLFLIIQNNDEQEKKIQIENEPIEIKGRKYLGVQINKLNMRETKLSFLI